MASAGRVTIPPGKVIDTGKPKPLPRDFVRLDKVQKGHLARKYVNKRRFNPDLIAKQWGIGYSAAGLFPGVNIDRPAGDSHLPRERRWVWDWQARTLGEVDRLPKYFTVPDLKKSALLDGAERVEAGTDLPQRKWTVFIAGIGVIRLLVLVGVDARPGSSDDDRGSKTHSQPYSVHTR